jgi:hypothetical protein
MDTDSIKREKIATEKQANIFQLPVKNNRYGILTSKAGCDEKKEKKVNSVTKREEGRNTIKKCKKKKHRIIILGDSHARGKAKELQYQLGYDFEVQGIVKPGASAESIVKSNVNLRKWTQDDFCIIWGGTHDVSKNETNKGLRSLKDFMNKHNQTNVIVMGVPQRYDLERSSCVNQEVKVFNRKLKNYMRVYKNSQVIEIDSDRELYTKQGLYLNVKGKESVVGKIINVINDVIRVKITNPWIMKWKVKETEDKGKKHTQELEESVGSEGIKDQDKQNRKLEKSLETKDSSEVDKENGELEKLQGRKDIRDPEKGNRGLEETQGIVKEDIHVQQSSARSKILPVTRNNDFLWEN